MTRHRFRSIFISDVHLGLRDCQAAYLLNFLRTTSSERLYLVGDILDIENAQRSPFWHPAHGDVLAEIFAIAARGTRVTYIPGNQDAILRRFAGQRFAGVDIALNAVHVGADGRADHAGVLYINDGDWVEHCTALIEHADGALELPHWTGQQQRLALTGALAAQPLPAAA